MLKSIVKRQEIASVQYLANCLSTGQHQTVKMVIKGMILLPFKHLTGRKWKQYWLLFSI